MFNIPLIITCPIVGAELSKKEYQYLPCSPDKLAVEAEKAVNAGASIIHLHVRDNLGNPSQDVDIFKEVTNKIKKKCDCIVQFSTGGAVGTPLKKRCAPLVLKPEMATLSMGSLNFNSEIYENSENTIKTIATALIKNNVMPELEIFDYGMIDTVYSYLKKDFIPKKFHINFVLGVQGGMGGHFRNLVILTERLDPDQTWSVGGIGKFQLPLCMHSIAMGGHVRMGIEDNIYYRKNELAKSNAQLIKRAVRIAKEIDRPIATVKQTREILGL